MKRSAFSLIELLVVMAIVAVVSLLVVPAFSSIGAAGKLKEAATAMLDQIEAARQQAEVNGSTVEIRLLKARNAPHYSGIEYRQTKPGGDLGKPMPLPDGVVLLDDTTLSRLLTVGWMTDGTLPQDDSRWTGGTYKALRLRSSGALELPSAAEGTKLFLTLAADRAWAAGQVPPNYATIQLNPETGRPLLYRP
jgi:uncharacterized protein (TIGR02596 family)